VLLVGGVVMAFVGVGVFFVSLTKFGSVAVSLSIPSSLDVPNERADATSGFLKSVLPSSERIFLTFKDSAMLIFIEAISWFLLRQYRSLIEDYKSFYKYYMRRANYLAAIKLAAEGADKSLMTRIGETLLAEDLTGRLKKGETTEDLGAKKSIDANFSETVMAKTSEIAQRALGQGKK
jgi:hypothetical protein